MTRAAAVILAAGRGERLGVAAKAALLLPDGRSFIDAVAATARAAGCARLVCVCAEPHLAVTRAAASAAGCDIAENAAPGRGMISSIAVGLDALDPRSIDVALIWPVDHPSVPAGVVTSVLASANRAGIVIPCWQGAGGHPTAFGAELWTALREAVDRPGGARAVVAEYAERVTRLEVPSPAVVRDVDLPGDRA
jgi:CTP:molybdopterin cytidylyltransferase MocA